VDHNQQTASCPSGQAGFTLLETVVAMTIVALVATASLAALGSDVRAADRAGRLLEAAALAETKLSAMEVESVEVLAGIPDSLAEGRFGPPFEEYSWVVTSEAVRREEDLYEVDVEVHSSMVSYRLKTRVFRPAFPIASITTTPEDVR
jgi:prepilin-type N-terminal cleavage/methylation domain-containing protein